MSSAVRIEHVSKVYPRPVSLWRRVAGGQAEDGLQALNDVSLEIAQGEFFGLLGPNGAGKTSLIAILAGLSKATAGRVSVCGYDVQAQFREARRSLGVVPQELVFDPFFTVRETLRLQSGYFGLRNNDGWIDEILENLGLASKADDNMRALSGGMKRRVLVAQALVHRPPVIVLDEPTAGVDVDLRRTLWQFISRLNRMGHTILLTTHYLEEAEELCHRIAMLKSGRIVALDTTRALLAKVGGTRLVLEMGASGWPEGRSRLLDERVVQRQGRRVVLRMDASTEIEALLAQVRGAGGTIEAVEVLRADLEDAFLDIMHGTAGSSLEQAA
ncbi:putative ABC transporter ATP-binding protein YbhF [Pigmentiphaga humi]|uniref:Putative ABC transporter ATP-binding protein YbhF n=1 Tax=Pigmentiphaga humi TaxID=2478468 RepID=A0A3P4B008_9BURK|nr:ABC transporter ATP-binding protein [Pigmentiphaga humi]VCU69372.1 putative ABC transporter ATP-binding protein YbhF [Pigmentiphaga humi]